MTTYIDFTTGTPTEGKGDGDGSVQVHWIRRCKSRLRPRSFLFTAKAASARARRHPIYRSHFQNSESGCCKSAATPSTTQRLHLTKALMPTVIDVLEQVNFHSEELRVEDYRV